MFVIIIFYNNINIRLLRRPRYCSASGLFAECGIPNCKAVIRSLIYKLITRLNESTNDVIIIGNTVTVIWYQMDFSYKALLGKDIVCAPWLGVTIMPNCRSCHVHPVSLPGFGFSPKKELLKFFRELFAKERSYPSTTKIARWGMQIGSKLEYYIHRICKTKI